MKITLPLFVLLTLSINAFAASLEPRTMVCDFDGENASKIYSIVTMPGIGTTFRLPDRVKITDFIVTDSKNFLADSNGTIGIVTPLALNKNTSVSIYTDDDRLFVFNLTSVTSSVVDQLVVIQVNNQQLFSQRVRADAQTIAREQTARLEARFESDLERQAALIKRQLMFSINSGYYVTGNIFAIERVSDDGVFTYVLLPKTQERPVVYLGEAGKNKKLEPVKYTDEGDYYAIHHVLTQNDKGFVLKLGGRVSEIRKK